MHDLLHDPLIGLRTRSGDTRASLPELLARLCAGDVDDYTGLRPHQADPWHVFLVQLAASVLARHPGIEPARPPSDSEFWRQGLLDLAEGQASAWELVVDDLTRPAFMQHPLTEGADELKSSFKPKATSPDELDVLITAKNHDLKMARADTHAAEIWLFALVLHQTTSGFLGQGNYGSVRMNGGFGSRAIVSMVRSNGIAPRFLEELIGTCAARATTVSRHGFANRGSVLCWMRPWARADSLYFTNELEPYFVEAVRPLRFVWHTDGVVAFGASSKARLIGPKTLDNGVMGDPWIPVNVEDKKKGESALTLAATGWTPDKLVDLLFEQGFRLTPLQKVRTGSGDHWFIGSVIVRGQGTTDGFHTFRLPVPAKVCMALLKPETAQPLAAFARQLLQLAADAASALRGALMSLAEGGPERTNYDKKAISAWVKQAAAMTTYRWQDRFFPNLWQASDPADREAVKTQWKAGLVLDVRQALQDAEHRLPIPHARRWRAVTQARGLLDALLRKAALLPERDPPSIHDEAEEQIQ